MVFPLKRVLVASCAALLFVACKASRIDDTSPPLTGVRVDADQLFGAAGCGQADGQIAKYAVLVHGSSFSDEYPTEERLPEFGPLVSSGLFDCFANATFLPDQTDPSPAYALQIFAYSLADFASNESAIQAALARAEQADAAAVLDPPASFVATCAATKRPDLLTNAQCVVLRDARVPSVPSADAGHDAEAEDGGNEDAGVDDAGADDAGLDDAGADAALEDAGDGGN